MNRAETLRRYNIVSAYMNNQTEDGWQQMLHVIGEINCGIEDPTTKKTLAVNVKTENGILAISPKGYGEPGAAKGCGSPVLLELYEGHLRAIVRPDILDDTKIQIIDLEDAKEDRVTDWS